MSLIVLSVKVTGPPTGPIRMPPPTAPSNPTESPMLLTILLLVTFTEPAAPLTMPLPLLATIAVPATFRVPPLQLMNTVPGGHA